MNLMFTGTCAADFSPLLSSTFLHAFDRNARRSSGLLVDRHIQIDCGPHTVESLRLLNIALSDVTDLIVTHLHSDHFLPDEIHKIAAASRRQKLRVWMHEEAALKTVLPDCDILPLHAASSVTIGDLSVLPLPANHTAYPLHYCIHGGGKSFFYGCDGAWLLYDTFYALKDQKLDLMILDGTVGDYTGDFRMAEHNSIPMIRLMLPSLKAIGAIDEKTAVYLSHLAPSLHKSHEETEKALAEDNIHIAFDGLEINLQ